MKALPCWISGFFVFKIMISIGLRIESENNLQCIRMAFGSDDQLIEFDLASRDDIDKEFRIKHKAEFNAETIDQLQAFIDAVRPLIKI
jgi:hypothetical protein